MKRYVSSNTKRSNQKGYISALSLLILSLFVSGGIAILNNQQAIMRDSAYVGGRAQAKFLAESALQQGKYHVQYVNTSFTGTSPVQSLVASNGNSIGSYYYNINKVGNLVTIVGTGVVGKIDAAAHNIRDVETVTYNLGSPGTGGGVSPSGASCNTPTPPLTMGVLALDPTAANAVTVNGGTFTISGGSLSVNSTSATAVTGASGSISAGSINIAGNSSLTGASLTGTVTIAACKVVDPMAEVVAPTTTKLTQRNTGSAIFNVASGTKTLDPGVYSGGINISGNANVTLNSGVYYISAGGFTATGNAQVSVAANGASNGVMIFINAGGLSLTSGGTVSLSPLTTGPYKGVTIFQDRANTTAATIAMSNAGVAGRLQLTGGIYFPAATLAIVQSGNTSTTIQNQATLIVAKKLALSGTGISYANSLGGPAVPNLKPKITCVQDAGNGKKRAFFGYTSEYGDDYGIPVGTHLDGNKFTSGCTNNGTNGDDDDGVHGHGAHTHINWVGNDDGTRRHDVDQFGQCDNNHDHDDTVGAVGKSSAYRGQPEKFYKGDKDDVFSVDFDPKCQISWNLHGNVVTAQASSVACASNHTVAGNRRDVSDSHNDTDDNRRRHGYGDNRDLEDNSNGGRDGNNGHHSGDNDHHDD